MTPPIEKNITIKFPDELDNNSETSSEKEIANYYIKYKLDASSHSPCNTKKKEPNEKFSYTSSTSNSYDTLENLFWNPSGNITHINLRTGPEAIATQSSSFLSRIVSCLRTIFKI